MLISKKTYPGHKSAVSRTLVFHFSPPKAEHKERQNDNVMKWKKRDHTHWHHLLMLTCHYDILLTFVEACRHVASRRAQQHPEDHGASHESPSVGWRQETQAGQDYSSRHINELIQTCWSNTWFFHTGKKIKIGEYKLLDLCPFGLMMKITN